MTNSREFLTAIEQSPLLEHAIGDMLEIGILRLDSDLVIRGWTRWLEKASGRSASAGVGRPLLEIFPTLSGTQVEAAFRRAAGGATVVLSHRLHRYALPLPPGPDSPSFDFMQQSARLLPLLADDGTMEGVLAIIEDVSDRVAREEELRVAMEVAQGASKAKSDFLASMSHELRTPLSAMIGYSELLADEIVGPLTATQRDHVDRMKICSAHLLGIVEEILSFARIDAGREEVHLHDVDAIALTNEAAALLEPQARLKHLIFRVNLPPEPVRLWSDSGKLRQILINLIGNAVKFTDSGSVTVDLLHAADSPTVCFRIEDSGPGISPQHLEAIFEPFTQVDQTRTRAKGGTGLGLPESRHLAALLGGSVTVESVRGKGSVFTLSLPARTGESA
jgi:signal transduction histidine kinase